MEHLVVWDAEAVLDFESQKSRGERKAVYTVVNLLAQTKQLAPPHMKSLKGEPGLMELRPRQGHAATRPIYRRTASGFVILSVAVESDKADFPAAVKKARERFARYDVDG